MNSLIKAPGVVAVALVLLAVECDGGRPEKSSSPDARPVADGAPYLCDLVPESAFRSVTGVTIPLKSDWSGPQTDNGLCVARPEKGPPSPLGVVWSYNRGERILRIQQENWANTSHRQLPAELGRGLAGHRSSGGLTGLPNYVIALFECGEEEPWISIKFAPMVRGRDAVRDMFDFMRIAQKRFGEIRDCTPRP